MTLGFVVRELASDAGDDLAFLVRQRADPAAFGTGLFVAQMLRRLSLGGVFEGAGEQRLHRHQGDFFHLGEGDVGSGTLLAPVPADDDFSPAVSEFLNAAKILGCQFVCGHVASLPEVGNVSADEIVCGTVRPKRASCKVGPALIPPILSLRTSHNEPSFIIMIARLSTDTATPYGGKTLKFRKRLGAVRTYVNFVHLLI